MQNGFDYLRDKICAERGENVFIGIIRARLVCKALRWTLNL